MEDIEEVTSGNTRLCDRIHQPVFISESQFVGKDSRKRVSFRLATAVILLAHLTAAIFRVPNIDTPTIYILETRELTVRTV
jgi:hypothetical protein